MKKLLFIALLMPLSLLAQKDSGTINFHTGYLYETVKPDSPYLALKGYAGTFYDWHFQQPTRPNTIQVFKNDLDNNKLIMEVGTSGVLHVYGDTLSVLKAIIKSYGIKLKS